MSAADNLGPWIECDRLRHKLGEALTVIQKERAALYECVSLGQASETSERVARALEAAWQFELGITEEQK